MDLLQTWLIVGVPGLALALGLFAGRARHRAWFGYAVLLAVALTFLLVPGDPISTALVGLLGVAFLAVGRGTIKDAGQREHHQGRDLYTTTPSGARE